MELLALCPPCPCFAAFQGFDNQQCWICVNHLTPTTNQTSRGWLYDDSSDWQSELKGDFRSETQLGVSAWTNMKSALNHIIRAVHSHYSNWLRIHSTNETTNETLYIELKVSQLTAYHGEMLYWGGTKKATRPKSRPREWEHGSTGNKRLCNNCKGHNTRRCLDGVGVQNSSDHMH